MFRQQIIVLCSLDKIIAKTIVFFILIIVESLDIS